MDRATRARLLDAVSPSLSEDLKRMTEFGPRRAGGRLDPRAPALPETLSVAEVFDSSTLIALVYLLARARGWTSREWEAERDAAIAKYLHPDHESATRRGTAVLNDEIAAWEHRLPELANV